MPTDAAKDMPQAPVPPQPTARRKFTDTFRVALADLKHALDEALVAPEMGEDKSASASPTESEASVSVGEVLETGEQVDQGLQHLQRHHRTLGSQINTILRLGPEEQRQLVALMWQTIEEMETALIRVQDAHRRLQRTLREKRLLLTDRKEELRRVLEREAAQLETIATLRQDNARLTRENGALQRQLARQQEDFGGLQRQYATLSQQHDELVGKYHNLFQDFTREQRKAGR